MTETNPLFLTEKMKERIFKLRFYYFISKRWAKTITKISFEEYVKHLDLNKLFAKLQVSDNELLKKEIGHFTKKEAERRKQIVINYFGESGINRIVEKITEFLFAPPKLPLNAKILDLGAGTGFFTVKIAKKVNAELPGACFYAMDVTPAMLFSLVKESTRVTPFIGIAENIEGSVREARENLDIPPKFDAIFSTLMLHHSAKPERVFEGLKRVLKKKGKAIVVDLCAHSFEEFRKEMSDVYLGFKPENIYRMARQVFLNVKVEIIPGICCECSGRSAKLFIAYMYNGL